MTGHQRFTLETDIKVYICDPRSPWQRGSNENTNRLLRDYLPKYTDLSIYSQAQLNAIARELNERPGKLWTMRHQLLDLMHVLHRPVEVAAQSGHGTWRVTSRADGGRCHIGH